MGRTTLVEVWNGSEDLRSFPGRVRGPSWRSETGRGTLGEDRDGSSRSGTGQGTLRKVRDSSDDPRGGLGLVWGPSGRTEMGWGGS